jgi:hypothetical protein
MPRNRLICRRFRQERRPQDGFDRDAEVPYGAAPDNKNPRFPGIYSLVKPSDGLEPSTPSLPSSDESEGTSGNPRARKPHKETESDEDE